MPKRPQAKRPDPIKAAQALGPLGAMLGAMMPAQVRLASREQQPPRPPAFIPPKGAKRGKRNA